MSSFGLSNIDLRILMVFMDVVEHEGFSAAAQAKGTSLSTITRDISALETRLGLKLCRRGRSGFAVTAEGEAVYRAARQLMDDMRTFEGRLRATRASVPDAVDIGVIDNMVANPDCPVLPVLRNLRRKGRVVSLRIGVHPVRSIDIMVRDRKLDLGFSSTRSKLAPLNYQPVFIERHALFVSRHCPDFNRISNWRPGQRSIPIPYVARSFPTEEFAKFEASMPFRAIAFGDSLEGVLTIVMSGFGAGILPLHAAAAHDELVALPYPEHGLSIAFDLVTRRDIDPRGPTAELARAFVAAGQQTFGKPQV